ncbi:MAG: transporter family protein [Sulfuriferula sp.]
MSPIKTAIKNQTNSRNFAVVLAALAMTPSMALACACGCGMFDIGMPGMALPSSQGGSVNLQQTFLDQNAAEEGGGKIPLSQSPDQQISTIFTNLNVQYQFNRDWGVLAMAPYWQRSFDTNANFGNGPVQVVNSKVSTLSDIRLMGIYSGFSPDMSSGLIFGLKLPTGTYTAPGFDRDTEPGTGSTDVLLGGYEMGQELGWGWFAQGILRSAASTSDNYRPGDSFQLVAGIHYDAFQHSAHIVPILMVNGTIRKADSGINSNPMNSGLKTVYLTPGVLIEINRRWQANANLYLPVYQYVNGIQLIPQQIASAGITYSF